MDSAPKATAALLARLEGEPWLWYRRFLIYATLGLTRSLKDATNKDRQKRRLAPQTAAGSGWSEACETYRWRERCAAYDMQELEADEAVRRQRQRDLRERAYALGNKLMDKGEKMLALPLVTTHTSKDGKKITIEPAEWVQTDAARMVESGIKIADQAVATDREIAEVEAGAKGSRSKELDIPINQLEHLKMLVGDGEEVTHVSESTPHMPGMQPDASGVLPDGA